jgi:hypothetical protein
MSKTFNEKSQELRDRFSDAWLSRVRDINLQSPEFQQQYVTPQTVQQQMNMEGVIIPYILKTTSGQIDSSSTGDTTLLNNAADSNKMYLITSITVIDSGGSTGQVYRLEFDDSAGNTRRYTTLKTAAADGSGDIENNGGLVLMENESLILNVTSAVASSTLDYIVSYYDMGFGVVWSQT